MKYKIQFREKGMKRYYNFSHRKLTSLKDAMEMKRKAQKYYTNRTFRLVRR